MGTQWTEDFGYDYVKDQGFASFLPSFVPANIQIASRDLLPTETKYSVARGQVRLFVNSPAVDTKILLVHMFSPEGLPDPDPEDGLPGPPAPPPQFANIELSVTAFDVVSSDAEVNPTSQLCLGHHQDGMHTLSPLSMGLVDSSDDTLDNGNDVQIVPKKNAADTNIRSVAWIDPHRANNGNDPDMPWLVLRMKGMEQLGLKIRWKLNVKYTRPNGRVISEDTVVIPSTNSIPSDWVTEPLTGPINIWANNDWINAILSAGFFGGDATLTYQMLKPDNSVLEDEKTLLFRIAGKNPDDTLCRQYIDQKALEYSPLAEQAGQTTRVGNFALWYVYAIAKSETRDEGGEPYYNQFLRRGDKYKDKKGSEGVPNWNNDGKKNGQLKVGGFGIKQVTGYQGDEDGNVPRSLIWNWHDNVDEGIRELVGVHKEARAWMQKQRSMATGALPPHTVQSVLFKDGTNRIMEDAVSMKRYNGASRRDAPDSYTDVAGGFTFINETPQPKMGHYCYWDKPRTKWSLSRYNDYKEPFVYVGRVCEEVDP